jgi:uncharacterized protein YybS (DUF2232 family)
MAAELGGVFAVDLLLIFVDVFFLFGVANFLGMARDAPLRRFIERRGLKPGDNRGLGYWRTTCELGVVVLVVVAVILTVASISPGPSPASLETWLFNLGVYLAGLTFFAAFRFYSRVVRRLAAGT